MSDTIDLPANLFRLLNDSINTYYQLDSSIVKLPASYSNLTWHSIYHLALFCLLVLIIIIFGIVGRSTLQRKSVPDEFTFHYNTDNKFNKKTVSTLIDNVGYYHPPWWYNSLLGTLIPFGYSPDLTFERELIASVDGDGEFYVDW